MGLAIARRFARGGFDIAALSRSADRDDALLDRVRAEGARAEGHAVDLADWAAAEQAIDTVVARQGPPSVLVYNAGAWNAGPPLGMPASDFARDLMLCVGSAYAVARAALPHLRRGGGSLLFTGGGLALRPQLGCEVLSLVAGKSAVRGLALALFEALRPEGVHAATVTIAGTVAPGGAFDPDRIAEHYWTLHTQPRDAWTAEIIHGG
jgi:NAD(P)-dependent dehydrogenase (short-subunit alcohol dehydrogenase family)